MEQSYKSLDQLFFIQGSYLNSKLIETQMDTGLDLQH